MEIFLGKRTIVVGDIHECFDELLVLLDTLRFNSQDILVSVGDMVDRGPKSWETAKYFRDTPKHFQFLATTNEGYPGL